MTIAKSFVNSPALDPDGVNVPIIGLDGFHRYVSVYHALPSDIAGLQLWLDASDASTLFQDAAKTIPATLDGDVIGVWADKSGNGNDATQATTAKKPLLKLAIQNGRNVVRFDGSDDILVASPPSGYDNVSMFMVSKWIAGGASEDLPFCVGRALQVRKVRGFYRSASGTTLGFATWSADIPSSIHSLDIGVAFHLFEAVQNGTAVTLARDGTTSAETLPATPLTTGADFSLGGIVSAEGYYVNLDVGEVLIYNSPLSAADRQSVETYLNTRWAVY